METASGLLSAVGLCPKPRNSRHYAIDSKLCGRYGGASVAFCTAFRSRREILRGPVLIVLSSRRTQGVHRCTTHPTSEGKWVPQRHSDLQPRESYILKSLTDTLVRGHSLQTLRPGLLCAVVNSLGHKDKALLGFRDITP